MAGATTRVTRRGGARGSRAAAVPRRGEAERTRAAAVEGGWAERVARRERRARARAQSAEARARPSPGGAAAADPPRVGPARPVPAGAAVPRPAGVVARAGPARAAPPEVWVVVAPRERPLRGEPEPASQAPAAARGWAERVAPAAQRQVVPAAARPEDPRAMRGAARVAAAWVVERPALGVAAPRAARRAGRRAAREDAAGQARATSFPVRLRHRAAPARARLSPVPMRRRVACAKAAPGVARNARRANREPTTHARRCRARRP